MLPTVCSKTLWKISLQVAEENYFNNYTQLQSKSKQEHGFLTDWLITLLSRTWMKIQGMTDLQIFTFPAGPNTQRQELQKIRHWVGICVCKRWCIETARFHPTLYPVTNTEQEQVLRLHIMISINILWRVEVQKDSNNWSPYVQSTDKHIGDRQKAGRKKTVW